MCKEYVCLRLCKLLLDLRLWKMANKYLKEYRGFHKKNKRGSDSEAEKIKNGLETMQCAYCSVVNADCEYSMKSCAGCNGVAYCSKQCQKKHWKVHKADCRDTLSRVPPTLPSLSNRDLTVCSSKGNLSFIEFWYYSFRSFAKYK